MKINAISFQGVREDKNTIEQLKKNNDYSLTENNQKRISRAIESLGQNPSEQNLDFLIDVTKNLKYGTNIDTGVKPRNDWKMKLQNAMTNSIAKSNDEVKEKYIPKVASLFVAGKPLTQDEKEIVELKNEILENVDMSELKDVKNPNILNLKGNLNSFVVSSEIPISQKKYILNRLAYFLSPEYEINPQLTDKKSVVLAETLNDLVVNDNKSKVPNTKAINQKHHAVCAAISISRKLMSYEYKDKFVDSILSELDSSDNLYVYDLAHLGEGKKIPTAKTFIDYQDALNKGYRIIDASSFQWMHVANKIGIDNQSYRDFTGFDRNFFGTFNDTQFGVDLKDQELQPKQVYYQSLLKTKSRLNEVIANNFSIKLKNIAKNRMLEADINEVQSVNQVLKSSLKKVLPSYSDSEIHQVLGNVLKLEHTYSDEIDDLAPEVQKYHFIPNEEEIIKNKKIKSFILDTYKDAVDKKALDDNVDKLNEYLSISNSISKSINNNRSLSSKIALDRQLFDAAAAYRASVMVSLIDNDYKNSMMISNNMPDEETGLLKYIDKYIAHVKNGDVKYIQNILEKSNATPTKEGVLEVLEAMKSDVQTILSDDFDEIYYIMGLGDRKNSLLLDIETLRSDINSGGKKTVEELSQMMGVKNKKANVLKKLDEYSNILENNPSEKDYVEIFNLLGGKSQINNIVENFKILSKSINSKKLEDEIYLMALKETHGIPDDADVSELQPIIMSLANRIQSIDDKLKLYSALLTVQNEKGEVVNTPNPMFNIMKKLENDGVIVSEKELAKLQERYDSIDKIRSQDEFSSRHGKISDVSLYKYTSGEKETLKKIQKSLNAMKSDVNKELVAVFREIRVPLEEQSKEIGVKTGNYWIKLDDFYGLYSKQQNRIIEQMSDKPYRIINDYEKAIDQIKNTPHSGISGSSVFHDRIGGHAQYVAEIAEKDGRDILYHDNSWGASEHENMWRDSEGLLRTDYSDNRGGELGYITDEQWRNGNYVDNLLHKTGKVQSKHIESRQIRKLKDEDKDFKFQLLYDFILPGVDNEANNIAAGIKDSMFNLDAIWLDDFEKKASKMSVKNIETMELKRADIRKDYNKDLKTIETRIEKTPFNPGINSRADFNALPDDDLVKVVFTKAAIKKSYNYPNLWKELAFIDTLQGLEPIKEKQKKIARENFNYAFGKSDEVLYSYALNKTKNKIGDILGQALKNNNISLPVKKQQDIVQYTASFITKEEKAQYDGSLKNSIEFMLNKMSKQFDNVVPKSENSEKAKQELITNLRKDLNEKLYFIKRDLYKDTDQNIAIKKYIDRKYNPQTNDEFVEIYRRLQDMTLAEFEKETADATFEDMGLKNIDPFEILLRYKATNELEMDNVQDLLYQKRSVKGIDISKTSPIYKYKKLQKKERGATYVDRTFDDIYFDFDNSLALLNIGKIFNKYKDENYRKYGAFPAYNALNVMTDEMLNDKISIINSTIEKVDFSIKSQKNNLNIYNLTDRVDTMLEGIPDDRRLTNTERKILNNLVGEFITDNSDWEDIENSLKSAYKMLEIPQKGLAKEYKEAFTDWKNEIRVIEKINPPEKLEKEMQLAVHSLQDMLNAYLIIDIPNKYHGILKKDLNDIVQMVAKKENIAYDRKLNERKIKKLFQDNSNKELSEKQINVFYDKMMIQLNAIKRLAEAYKMSVKQSKTYSMEIDQGVNVVYAKYFDTDSNADMFANGINDITNSSKELNKEDIQKLIAKIIASLSELNKNELLDSKEIKKLSLSILNYRNSKKLANNYQKNINKNRDNLDNRINTYIEKNVPKDSQARLAGHLKNFVAEQFNPKKSKEFDEIKFEKLCEKLHNDYKKYNYLVNPQELMSRYLKLVASDGLINNAKTPAEKKMLISEKNYKKKALESFLRMSSILETNNLLMEASDNSISNIVATKFKNYDSLLQDKNGLLLPLSDPRVIDSMVRNMIMDKDNSAAKEFVENLGIVDQFLQIEDKFLNVNDMKKQVDKVGRMIVLADKQTFIYNEALKLITNDCSLEDFETKIDDAKQYIAEKTKKLPKKKISKLFMENLDTIKSIAITNPDIPRQIIIEQYANEMIKYVQEELSDKLQKEQEIFVELDVIDDLINKLEIPEYREAYKYRENFQKKKAAIDEYNHKVISEVAGKSKSLTVTSKTSI